MTKIKVTWLVTGWRFRISHPLVWQIKTSLCSFAPLNSARCTQSRTRGSNCVQFNILLGASRGDYVWKKRIWNSSQGCRTTCGPDSESQSFVDWFSESTPVARGAVLKLCVGVLLRNVVDLCHEAKRYFSGIAHINSY
jgi:hypothetical protein